MTWLISRLEREGKDEDAWEKWMTGRGRERQFDYTLMLDSLLTGRFLVWVSEQFISVLKHWFVQEVGTEDEGRERGMEKINHVNIIRTSPTYHFKP